MATEKLQEEEERDTIGRCVLNGRLGKQPEYTGQEKGKKRLAAAFEDQL